VSNISSFKSKTTVATLRSPPPGHCRTSLPMIDGSRKGLRLWVAWAVYFSYVDFSFPFPLSLSLSLTLRVFFSTLRQEFTTKRSSCLNKVRTYASTARTDPTPHWFQVIFSDRTSDTGFTDQFLTSRIIKNFSGPPYKWWQWRRIRNGKGVKCEHLSYAQSSPFTPEDGGSVFLRNVGMYLQVHMVLQTRRPTSTHTHTVLNFFFFGLNTSSRCY
jgi:hypothetical protein